MPASSSSERDFLSGLSDAQRRGLFAAMLVGIYVALFWVTGGLSDVPYQDEIHFAETATLFAGEFPPSLEQLRSYPEVITPLAFVLWGRLQAWTGDVLFSGRLLNMLISASLLLLVAMRRGKQGTTPILAALGILLCPYFLPLSATLYTDVLAATLGVLGTRFHVRGHHWLGCLFLVLAIATRQYMVAVPSAIAAWALWRILQGERCWSELCAGGLAAATLLGWFAFFGGLAPPAGMDYWIPRYPAPMTNAFDFRFAYGLYFLACIGAYFVVIEAVLFRRPVEWRGFLAPRSLALAAGLLVMFALFPPLYEDRVQGALERATLSLLPHSIADTGRLAIFFALAWLACQRFTRRIDLAFCLIAVNTVLMLKAQLSWDKYAFPVLLILWFLKSESLLAGDALPSPAPSGKDLLPPAGRKEAGTAPAEQAAI